MVGFFVYILWDVSFLCIGIVFPTSEVKRDV